MTGWIRVMGAAVVCAGAAQALTIDKIMRTSATGAEAVLSYDELATDQSVVFAWGSSDGGANYTAWPNAVAGTGCAGAGSRTCRVKLPKGAADAANLRAFLVPASYYASYLRGYGNRYIDTDYYPNKDTTIFADFQMFDIKTAQQRVCGTPTSGSGLVVHIYMNGSLGWSWSFSHAGNWTSSGAFPGVLATLDRTTVLLDAYSSDNAGQYVLTINGVQKYSCTLSSGSAKTSRTATSVLPLYLFADGVGTDKYGNMRLYQLTCSTAGTPARDFRPYVKDGVACVYDSITDKYFYPTGSGEPMDAGAPAAPSCVSASSATVSPTAMLAGPVVTSAVGVFDETSPSVQLGFTASGSARELWFAWSEDGADKGTSFAAWPCNERIATVAANVGYGRYAIPPSARDAKKGRFFLLAPGGSYDCAYIRGCGLQGIDTGVKAGTNVAVTVDMQLDYTDIVQQRAFGVGTSTFTLAAYINGYGQWAWGAQDTDGNWTSSSIAPDRSRTQITIDCPNNVYRLVMDGVTRKTTAISSIVAASNFTKTAGWPIALLCARGHATNKSFGNIAYARLYGAELSDNGTVVRRMRPCVKNGVAMMHDEINNVDYGNCVTNLNTQFIPGGRADAPSGAVAGELLDFAATGVGKVPDDIFADATLLWRGRRLDADGLVDNNELLDTLNRTSYATTARGSTGYRIAHSNELVRMPGRGVERQANTIVFPQTLILTNDAGTLGYSYPSTLQFDNVLNGFDDHYTVMARVRSDLLDKPASSSQWLFNIGHSSGKGILYGFSGTGAHTRSTQMLVGGSTPPSISNALVTNGWVDVAVVADGRRVSTFVVRDWKETGDMTGFTQYWTGRVPETRTINPNGNWLILGSESPTVGPFEYPTPSGVTVNAVKAFRGSVAQLAVWPRALSKAELFAACGWPRQDLWRVGVDDGADAEFTSGTQAETIAPDGAEWPFKEGLAANGSVTFTFPVWAAYEDQNGQVLRWKGLPSSAQGFLAASINGQRLKTLSVRAGKWTQWFVPANCLVAGTNTITLTRTDGGSGRLRADVVAFGGGWQLGSRNNSSSEFGHESYGLKDFWAADGNYRDVQRVIYCGRSPGRTNACYHVHVPAEMAGLYTWKLRVVTGGSALPTSPVVMNVDLNGMQKLSTTVASYTEYSFLIDPEELPEGDNVFNFQNTSGNTGSHYIMLDMMSLEPLRPSDGTFMFVR